ncbi:hypothetical protein ABZV92_05975 [Streptomyces rubiginosohelvolus]|uniref:hypothetical protein n=1 Tax=Streptomyces rubiginosohelvolus TaxID=67362 RepID=UPI0033BBEDD9
MTTRPSRGRTSLPAQSGAPMGDGAAERRTVGRVEAAVSRQVRALRRDGADPARVGVEAIARELARAMDTAGARLDPYAVAQVTPKLLAVLDRLTPKEGDDDALNDLLADMSAPD